MKSENNGLRCIRDNKGKDFIVYMGYYIHWCKKHKKPTVWCEINTLESALDSAVKSLLERDKTIKELRSDLSNCVGDNWRKK